MVAPVILTNETAFNLLKAGEIRQFNALNEEAVKQDSYFRLDLRGVNLYKANLEKANLKYANLEGANLEKANLRGANLRGANLEGANLEGAYLEGANLEKANLRGANLEGANLEGANLENASLWCANLTRANLTGANLKGADMDEANLTGANLTGLNLTGLNLTGLNLTGLAPKRISYIKKWQDRAQEVEDRIFAEQGIEEAESLKQAIEEQEQIIKGANFRPLDMKNGRFGKLAAELANKSTSLNDAIIDWGYHWTEFSREKLEVSFKEPKQDLKETILDILSVYTDYTKNEDGKAIYELREQLTEEKLDTLVNKLYDTLIENQERINLEGHSEQESRAQNYAQKVKASANEVINYLHGDEELSPSFLEKLQAKRNNAQQETLAL